MVTTVTKAPMFEASSSGAVEADGEVVATAETGAEVWVRVVVVAVEAEVLVAVVVWKVGELEGVAMGRGPRLTLTLATPTVSSASGKVRGSSGGGGGSVGLVCSDGRGTAETTMGGGRDCPWRRIRTSFLLVVSLYHLTCEHNHH